MKSEAQIMDPTIRPVTMSNSDVEVSEETIVAMDPFAAGMTVHLCLARNLDNVCVHRLRRHMFGKNRLPLLSFIDGASSLRNTVDRWYNTALSRHLELLHGGARRVERGNLTQVS